MIKTPIGEIEIYIDANRIDYHEQPMQVDKLCSDLKGRYKVEVEFIPDRNEHVISCVLNPGNRNIDYDTEGGERLECRSLYQNDIKLSIGIESDSGYIYLENGKLERISDCEYDYDGEYIDCGIQYRILKFTKTKKYVFGIAWIDNLTEEREIQTWFGADPTIF